MATHSRTWAAAVVRPQVSWLAERRYVEHSPTPAWVPGDPARLLHVAGAGWFARKSAGTVLWQPGADEVRDRDRTTAALLAAAQDYGWASTPGGKETGWFTFTPRAGEGPVIAFGVGPWIAQHRTSLFRLDEPANVVAARLARYEELTGTAWRGTGGMTGCAGIRQSHEEKTRGGQPLWRWDKAPRGIVGSAWELRGSVHHRPMTDEERGMARVLCFDTRAGYLAAASLAEVGWSAPREQATPAFDYARAGYWTVMRADLPDEVGGVPLRLLVKPGAGDTVTLTTPVMTYLYERGVTPAPVAAWAAEQTGRHLRRWAERLRDARAAGGDEVPAVKDTYSRTVGMMGRPGGRVYRPDWRDEVVDRARVNLVRKIDGAGVSPLRWNVDAVWIATDEEPEEVGARLGAYDTTQRRWRPEIGKLRLEATMTPAEYLERYEGRA